MPKIIDHLLYWFKFREIFLAAAAGIMTKEPISSVPATFNPKATINATRMRNIKFILFIGIFIAWAISFEIIPNIKLSEIRLIINIVKKTRIAEIIRSNIFIAAMSPNNASKSSGSGVNKRPKAKLSVKNIPTNVSCGNSVLFSSSQIPTIAIKRAENAPKNGFIFNSNDIAMPGKATCDKASPTRDILRKTMNEPTYPAPRPIRDPVANCSMNKLSINDRRVYKILPRLRKAGLKIWDQEPRLEDHGRSFFYQDIIRYWHTYKPH